MTTDPRLQRTKFAARAATLAEQFRNAVEDHPVGTYRGEMTSPEGSTGGGVQALQHIRLVPVDGRGRTYVVGNANRAERRAELRTLEYVDRVSIERFRAPTGLDPAAYAAFVGAASQFLEMFGLDVTLAQPPARGFAGLGDGAASRLMLVAWSMLMLAIGVVLGVLAEQGHWLH
jgi:hypothetical protein